MKIYPNRISHPSDFFPQMYKYCVQLLRKGKAYAVDSAIEVMKDERKTESRASVVEQVRYCREPCSFRGRAGSEGTQWCTRARISIDNVNKALRGPIIYHCNFQPHHRTGSTWKAYPTYDCCAPIFDSIEGVTHGLRTNAYRNRNPQYVWFQKALSLREVGVFLLLRE